MNAELRQMASETGFVLQQPASEKLIEQARDFLHLPPAVCDFYAVSNGLQYEWFRIPPIHDPANVKQTWDSLQRVNDPGASKFLRGEPELLQRFLIFAELSGPECAVIQREDGSIWITENEELHQTELEIIEFISTCIREVIEL